MKEEKLRMLEMAFLLQDLKVGDAITDQQFEAIQVFAGPFLKVARQMKETVWSTTFHEGKASALLSAAGRGNG